MPEQESRSPAQPAIVLGLTFLVIGLTFALPYRLLPDSEIRAMSEHWSAEVGNVYACTAWAGWAHFVYAFRGQSRALTKSADKNRTARLLISSALLILVVAALTGVRALMGVALFGAVVWLYFIDHFLKAEETFEGRKVGVLRWLGSAQPLITFGWLSVVLMNIGGVNEHPWLLWLVSLALGVGIFWLGGWRSLASGDARSPLLSLFFVAEALMWGTMSRYGGPAFLAGVYVVHIAAGSYFHYFGSYFFAHSKSSGRDRILNPLVIVAINLAIIGLGYCVAFMEPLARLRPILGIQWFTLWVAVHLVVSDLFPTIKNWKTRPATA